LCKFIKAAFSKDSVDIKSKISVFRKEQLFYLEMCELRSSIRIPVHFCATFRYPTEDSEAVLGGVIGDLTERGCFATVAGILPLDLPIVCTLYLGDNDSVSVLGKAVRMTSTGVPGFNGYGIMFDTLNPETKEKIENAIRERVHVLREVCKLIHNNQKKDS
jgi:hypothetical protein